MTETFKRILVAVDFTKRSDDAIKKACQLVHPVKGVIGLLYVCKPLFSLNIFTDTGYFIAPASEILTEWEINQRFARYSFMIYKHTQSVLIERKISAYGKIENIIEQTASEFGPELIILANRREKRFSFLPGQISTEKIAKKTECLILDI